MEEEDSRALIHLTVDNQALIKGAFLAAAGNNESLSLADAKSYANSYIKMRKDDFAGVTKAEDNTWTTTRAVIHHTIQVMANERGGVTTGLAAKVCDLFLGNGVKELHTEKQFEATFASRDTDGKVIPNSAQLTKGYIHCKKFFKAVTYAITKYNKTIREESNSKVADVSDDEEVESLPKPTPTPAPELNNLKDILGWGDGGKAAEEHKMNVAKYKPEIDKAIAAEIQRRTKHKEADNNKKKGVVEATPAGPIVLSERFRNALVVKVIDDEKKRAEVAEEPKKVPKKRKRETKTKTEPVMKYDVEKHVTILKELKTLLKNSKRGRDLIDSVLIDLTCSDTD